MSVARELARADTEPHWRSSVSRAYYAAFHVAREAWEMCEVKVPKGPEAHERIKCYLNYSKNSALEQAGAWLATLRTSRLRADYDLASDRTSKTAAKTSVVLADDLIRVLENSPLMGGDASAEVAAVRQYLRQIEGQEGAARQ